MTTPAPSAQRWDRPAPAPAVMIVDDEAAFADALAFRLQARGIPASVAYRGEDALAALSRSELEVIVLDLNMPGLHGLEALPRIKARRPDIEVVLLTGEADFSVAARGMRRGAGDYLLKPVDFDSLLASLDKARDRAREHRERLRAIETGRLMALGALAAGVGHEINNPLLMIMQGAEWLLELVEDAAHGEPDLEEIRNTATVINKQAERAGNITAQLLALAHQTRSGTAETRLEELIAKVADTQQERARSLHTLIERDLSPDLPALPCSPAELEPVLHHLLRNALDAIEALRDTEDTAGTDRPQGANARIRISASVAEGAVSIRIQDSGEGVAPEHAARVFEPFFSTRPVGRGVGLGLTVCHSIVTALGGTLRLATAPTGGTLCTVEIPKSKLS